MGHRQQFVSEGSGYKRRTVAFELPATVTVSKSILAGIVNGSVELANAATAQASADLLLAYGSLSPVECGLVLATTFGNNQVLTPNVYCLGAASVLNGNLVLDGQGNPNATHYLVDVYNWSNKQATGMMMFLSFLVVLLPSSAFINMLSRKLIDGMSNLTDILQKIQEALTKIETDYGFQVLTGDRIKFLSEWGIKEVSNIANSTLFGLLLLFIAYFMLWFMPTAGKKSEDSFFDWLPLKAKNITFLRKELNELVYSNAIGIPLMGIV